jgi:hypothetical protein
LITQIAVIEIHISNKTIIADLACDRNLSDHKMKKFLFIKGLLSLFIILCPLGVFAQIQNDSTKTFKNTVRFNITNPFIFGNKYNVFGYERVVNRQQTFSIDIGRFSMPKFVSINTDSMTIGHNYTDKGFTIAADYRFYLRRENKYDAPRGIYVGPYYSYIYFDRKNTWSMNTANFNGNVNTDLRMNLNLIGAQLGYQFVIKKRIALDLILIGPGLWFYDIKASLNTTLDAEDEAALFKQLNEIIASKFPGHEILIRPGDIKANGTSRSAFTGFRYMAHLGFRF